MSSHSLELEVAETQFIRPLSARVTRLPDNGAVIEFELPDKIVAVQLPAEAKQSLVQALTGVHLPDVPSIGG